jgi:hypothetical protein
VLFLLVDMGGAKTPTPSGEGDPSKDLITSYEMVLDKRFTGYSSCDAYNGVFKCLCDQERQPPTTPCDQNSVGFLDLKNYYKGLPVGATGQECGWSNTNVCQVNLGAKLATNTGKFTWYSTPAKLQGSKWGIQQRGKSVHAYCVLDGMGKSLAPSCTTKCKQQMPSLGVYNECYYGCFFTTVLGPDWQTKAASTGAGVTADSLVTSFAAAYDACPSATGPPSPGPSPGPPSPAPGPGLADQQWVGPSAQTKQTILLKEDLKMCMDVAGGSVKKGAKVQIWGCNNLPQQQWNYDTKALTIHPMQNSSMCIDIQGGKGQAGSKLQLWECNGLAQQKWTPGGTYQWHSGLKAGTTMCIDLAGGDRKPGNQLDISGCISS